jgi:hypothetical protein
MMVRLGRMGKGEAVNVTVRDVGEGFVGLPNVSR